MPRHLTHHYKGTLTHVLPALKIPQVLQEKRKKKKSYQCGKWVAIFAFPRRPSRPPHRLSAPLQPLTPICTWHSRHHCTLHMLISVTYAEKACISHCEDLWNDATCTVGLSAALTPLLGLGLGLGGSAGWLVNCMLSYSSTILKALHIGGWMIIIYVLNAMDMSRCLQKEAHFPFATILNPFDGLRRILCLLLQVCLQPGPSWLWATRVNQIQQNRLPSWWGRKYVKSHQGVIILLKNEDYKQWRRLW